MLDGKKLLGLVVGRGGSKGLPGKNVMPLLGKPVVAWTVEAALESKYLDKVIISSDDDEIIAAAVAAGAEAPFKRPIDLAGDKVTLNPVILHALEQMEDTYDYVVLLQATSPLRSAQDIDLCIETIDEYGAPSCLSVYETIAPPFQTFILDQGMKLKSAIGDIFREVQRQDMPDTYQLNGAVCVLDVEWFERTKKLWSPETVGCVMPFERAVDIDTKTDFELAVFYAERAKKMV